MMNILVKILNFEIIVIFIKITFCNNIQNFQMALFESSHFSEPNWNENLLGKGAFGSVFKLQEKKTGNYYAVKILNSGDPSDPANVKLKVLFLR